MGLCCLHKRLQPLLDLALKAFRLGYERVAVMLLTGVVAELRNSQQIIQTASVQGSAYLGVSGQGACEPFATLRSVVGWIEPSQWQGSRAQARAVICRGRAGYDSCVGIRSN